MDTQYLTYILITVACFVPAIVFHEAAHGFAAYKLGDPTARSAGRVSFNPLRHIDPFGTVILPFLLMVANMPVFGYAKPVPYNPRYFKDPRKGDLIVGLAGPAANLALALIGAGLAWLMLVAVPASDALYSNQAFILFVGTFLPRFVLINLFLMFFNLLPIPPLDGSSIFAFLIPERYLPQYYRVQQYAFPVFIIAVIFLPEFLHVDPIGMYLDATAINLANALLPFSYLFG